MQRGGSRLRLTSAGTPGQAAPSGRGADRAGAKLGASPEDAAVLKEVGLTSDEDSSDDAWGSSGGDNKSPVKSTADPESVSQGKPNCLPIAQASPVGWDSMTVHTEVLCHPSCLQRCCQWQEGTAYG